ncbi:MAG: hypothetical protein UV60_C0010G0002 [Parcubacteria group bacterium GW2011_GWA2_43_11]|nr:MAG: hypothetical protein UV60_C0010G0002 [Parcubacteria group bacterium GW2011_GWA2_43_11]
MGNFNKGGDFGGGRRFGGKGGDRGGNRGGGFGGGRNNDRGDRPDMHRATCSDCGKSCEVPFRPTGDSQPRFGDRRPSTNGGGNSGENYKTELRQINETLGKILKALTPATQVENKSDVVRHANRHEKAPRKEIDTEALNKTLQKAVENNASTKKAVAPTKKVVTKVVTKKVASKKVVAKKATKKK